MFLSVVGGEENIHDVMRAIWNHHSGDPCHGDRFSICLMLLVNCCILSREFAASQSYSMCQEPRADLTPYLRIANSNC